jgi:hypothetical protein
MKRMSACVLAGALGLPLAQAAIVQATPIVDNETMSEGTVKSTDSTNKSFVLTTAGKDTTVRYDDSTRYTLDGSPSTMDKVLRVGATVKVTHKDGLASRVEGKSDTKKTL